MAQDRNFVQINGHKWAYLRRGAGRPLFLLHGFMCYADYYLPIAKELEDQFDVIIPDLPSFGYSPKLHENNYKNILLDLEQFIDSFNFEKVNIFGTSFGGFLALEYALNYPDKTNIVFAHSPFWRKESLTINKIEEIEFMLLKMPNKVLNILKAKLVFKRILNWVLKLIPGIKRTVRTYENEILEAASLFDMQGNREILDSLLNNDFYKRINKFKSDCILIACTKDNVIQPEEVVYLNSIIKKKLVKVKNQGHEFILKGHAKVAKIIKEYVIYGRRSQDPDFTWE